MIRLAPECFPCFLRQADLAARACGAPEELRMALAARVAGRLACVPAGEIPAKVASGLQALVREALETDDPFAAVKERELARFDETARRAAEHAAASPDPLEAAVALAAYGNVMDAGIVDRESREQATAALPAGGGLGAFPGELRDRLGAARQVGVLLDNAGEIAYDVPLLSLLRKEGKRVWIGVKGGPVIDDVTEGEARRAGLAAFGEIVSNGNRGVGTDLDLCPPAFRKRLAASDLVLVKGQANFETLAGRARNAVFILRVKCPVLSRVLGRREGEMIVLDGRGTP